MDRRLKSKKQIEVLFEKGNSLFIYPIKLVFLKDPIVFNNHNNFFYGVSVSKRNFKRAVDRNRLKRQMREAIRNHQDHFVVDKEIDLKMMFIYVGKTMLEYQKIVKAVKKLSHHFNDN